MATNEALPEESPDPCTVCPSVSVILENPSSSLMQLPEIVAKTLQGPVEFVVCDPGVMRFLNWKWRKINKPTDVLTFDLSSPGEEFPEGVVYIDGRLAPPIEEVLERLYHGWLHLCGSTHDTPEDAAEMNRLTIEMVREGLKAVNKL